MDLIRLSIPYLVRHSSNAMARYSPVWDSLNLNYQYMTSLHELDSLLDEFQDQSAEQQTIPKHHNDTSV